MNWLKFFLVVFFIGGAVAYTGPFLKWAFPNHQDKLVTAPVNAEYSVTYFSRNTKIFRIGKDSLLHVLNRFTDSRDDSSQILMLEIRGVAWRDSSREELWQWEFGKGWDSVSVVSE